MEVCCAAPSRPREVTCLTAVELHTRHPAELFAFVQENKPPDNVQAEFGQRIVCQQAAHLPARSTRLRAPVRRSPVPSWRPLMCSVSTECDREDAAFMAVACNRPETPYLAAWTSGTSLNVCARCGTSDSCRSTGYAGASQRDGERLWVGGPDPALYPDRRTSHARAAAARRITSSASSAALMATRVAPATCVPPPARLPRSMSADPGRAHSGSASF